MAASLTYEKRYITEKTGLKLLLNCSLSFFSVVRKKVNEHIKIGSGGQIQNGCINVQLRTVSVSDTQ